MSQQDVSHNGGPQFGESVEGARSQINRRRFFSVSSAAAAAAVLAACGSNTGRETPPAATPSAPGSPAASASGSAPAPTSSDVKVTLSQWYHQYGEAGTQQAVEKYAAAFPDATVEVQWIPGDFDGKVAAALLTDEGPDVFEFGNGPTIDMIQGGQVLPLDDILGDAKDDFTPSLVERMTHDGKLYAVPQVIDMQLMVYRKSLLEAAGVKPPTTFDELAEAAKKLTTKDVKGLFLGNDGGGVAAGPVLWSVGADYLTADNKVGFTDPQVAVAFGKMRELFTSGSLLLGAPTDWFDPSAIIQGLCAMQWTGLWTFPQLQKELGDDFGVLPWPKFSADGKGAPSVPIGAYGSVVSSKSANPEVAKAFVKWLWVDSAEHQMDFAQSYGFHVPARKSLAEKAENLKSGQAAEAVRILQENGHAQNQLLWTPASATALSDAVSRILKDGADPAKELAAVVTKAEAELKRVVK